MIEHLWTFITYEKASLVEEKTIVKKIAVMPHEQTSYMFNL